MLSLVNILTFLWLLWFAVHSGRKIAKGDQKAIHFVIPIFFIFCGIPLLLDETIGRLDYAKYPGFALASNDLLTCYIYCAYVAFTPFFWLFLNKHFNRQRQRRKGAVPIEQQRLRIKKIFFTSDLFLFIVMASPVAAVFFTENPLIYLRFSTTLRSGTDDLFKETHSFISLASNLSVVAGAVWIALAKPQIYGRWPHRSRFFMYFIFVFIAIWLHGKRAILATALVLLLLALRYRGVVNSRNFYRIAVSFVVFLLSYSLFFQFYSNRISTTLYENMRIDYGRDDVIKITIFAELNPSVMKILDYRGQSLMFDMFFYIPRNLWSEKPFPYAQYFTSAIFLLRDARLMGWGMTTSWLEEAIANFSWFGLLLGPLWIWFICKIGDSSEIIYSKILTPFIANLFLLVELSAFIPLFFIWGITLVFGGRKQKRRLYRVAQGSVASCSK
jgi:hypothetical protein